MALVGVVFDFVQLRSSMKRVSSDPEIMEGPFRGVVLHSEAAGPGGALGMTAVGEREKVRLRPCFFLPSFCSVLLTPCQRSCWKSLCTGRRSILTHARSATTGCARLRSGRTAFWRLKMEPQPRVRSVFFGFLFSFCFFSLV